MTPQNKRGFTLIEVLITLTLLTVVLALAAGAIFQIYTYYAASEELWMVKQEVTAVTDWMINSLQLAAEAEIINETYSSTKTFSVNDKYTYVYRASDGFIYYRNPGETAGTKLTNIPITCAFKIPAATNRALEFKIGGETRSGRIYDVDSAVTLLNLAKISAVKGNNGSVVKIAGNDLVLSEMTSSMSGGMCFIATAAYGSPISPAVLLLRDFRDDVLLTTKPGEMFVAWYYRASPSLAKMISENSYLKPVVRVLLMPFIIIAVMIMFPLVFLTFILLILLISFYKYRKIAKK